MVPPNRLGRIADEHRPCLAIAASILATVLLGALAWLHRLPQFVYDDGGITLRYATRLAQGHGLTYNDGERVDGCSDPLYTLIAGALLALGLSPAEAVRAIGSASFALLGGVSVFALARWHSFVAATVAFAIIASNDFLFPSMFDGLESPLTALCAALLFLALHTRNEIATGAVLGALVANKLDGALAALSFTAVVLAVRRPFPWKAALAAVVIAAPMFAWLAASFGSLLPNSMLAKLDTTTPGGFSPRWVLGYLRWAALVPSVCAIGVLLVPLRERSERALPTLVLGTWVVFHVVAYSLVDLGAPFPWYVTPLIAPLAILGAVGVDAFLRFVFDLFVALARPTDSAALRVRGGIAVAVIVIAAASIDATLAPFAERSLPLFGLMSPALAANEKKPRRAEPLPPYVRGDLARLAAGAWLARYAAPGEVLATGFGLPALAYRGPVFDTCELNCRRDSPLRERAVYDVRAAGTPPEGDDWRVVARFRFDPLPTEAQSESPATEYDVFATSASHVRRSGSSFGVSKQIPVSPIDVDDFEVLSPAWRDYLVRALPDLHANLAR